MRATTYILVFQNVRKIKKRNSNKKMLNKKEKQFISPGHNACAGCGQLSAVQAVMRGLTKDTIIANATGCLEVTTTAYPESSWGLPWIHSLFENASAVASGIQAALRKKGDKKTKVLVQAGDGGTFDIGLGLISGMWERGENILYVCYDTESYSNTGIQASGATPYGSSTTTTPSGDESIGSTQNKKDMLAIALAHGLKYVAQSAAGFPDDITRKVKKALTVNGPAYIQILAPCIPGWNIGYGDAASMGKLAVSTGLYPLLEYIDGELKTSSITSNYKTKPVKNYLSQQGRFKHLKEKDIATIQKIADYNINKYKLK
jgi:pyruvate ferredoxin oxidoreductase beta subunit